MNAIPCKSSRRRQIVPARAAAPTQERRASSPRRAVAMGWFLPVICSIGLLDLCWTVDAMASGGMFESTR